MLLTGQTTERGQTYKFRPAYRSIKSCQLLPHRTEDVTYQSLNRYDRSQYDGQSPDYMEHLVSYCGSVGEVESSDNC